MSNILKCSSCGKFISYDDFENGATYYHIPDTEFSFERNEYTCINCNKR